MGPGCHRRWPDFIRVHFRPILEHWLAASIGTDARIFQDTNDIVTGQRWEQEIAGGLAASKVMVALLSRNYFRSEWCRRELAFMLARAEWLRSRGLEGRVIFPVVLHYCDLDDLPAPVRELQLLRIHPYANPFMHSDSAGRGKLSALLEPLCEQIARCIAGIDDASYVWPPPPASKHMAQLMPPRPPGSSGPFFDLDR